MAHNIQILENGEACFIECDLKNKAWHGLGKRFDHLLTVAEAIEGAHADYEVESRGLAALTAEQMAAILAGRPITVTPEQIAPNNRAIVRNDRNTCLGVVGNRYEIVQNSQAFAFIDALCSGELDGPSAQIECAGVLGVGERIFITARFAENIKIGSGDEIERYAVFTNSFDGTSTVSCMITPVRVVCNNTLNMALDHNDGKVTFRHTKSIHDKIAVNKENILHAAQCLKVLDAYSNAFKKDIETLGNVSLDEEKVDQILKLTLCPENQRKELIAKNFRIADDKAFSTQFRNTFTNFRQHLFGGIGQNKLTKGSGLWLMNGFTTAVQNGMKFKNDESKFDSILGGKVSKQLNFLHDQILMAA